MIFRDVFPDKKRVFLVVVHVQDPASAVANACLAFDNGADGVFLIDHTASQHRLFAAFTAVRRSHPSEFVGLNLLSLDTPSVFSLADERVSGIWADNCGVPGNAADLLEADEARAASVFKGPYFGGFAFKYGVPIPDGELDCLAKEAINHMDVLTTSGVKTGESPAREKIQAIRAAIGAFPLAIASGITANNVRNYPEADCFLVATGVNYGGDFHKVDSLKVSELAAVIGSQDW